MNWEDFLTFCRMITPYLIQALFLDRCRP